MTGRGATEPGSVPDVSGGFASNGYGAHSPGAGVYRFIGSPEGRGK